MAEISFEAMVQKTQACVLDNNRAEGNAPLTIRALSDRLQQDEPATVPLGNTEA